MSAKGRPKLKLRLTGKKQNDINDLLRKGGLSELEEDKLYTIILAAHGGITHAEIADKLDRARSAIQKWIQRWRQVDGDLDDYLKIRRHRVSPIGKKPIFDELDAAFRAGKIKTGHTASRWIQEKYGIKTSPQRMNYWLNFVCGCKGGARYSSLD